MGWTDAYSSGSLATAAGSGGGIAASSAERSRGRHNDPTVKQSQIQRAHRITASASHRAHASMNRR
jgi:hypothetical protein